MNHSKNNYCEDRLTLMKLDRVMNQQKDSELFGFLIKQGNSVRVINGAQVLNMTREIWGKICSDYLDSKNDQRWVSVLTDGEPQVVGQFLVRLESGAILLCNTNNYDKEGVGFTMFGITHWTEIPKFEQEGRVRE